MFKVFVKNVKRDKERVDVKNNMTLDEAIVLMEELTERLLKQNDQLLAKAMKES